MSGDLDACRIEEGAKVEIAHEDDLVESWHRVLRHLNVYGPLDVKITGVCSRREREHAGGHRNPRRGLGSPSEFDRHAQESLGQLALLFRGLIPEATPKSLAGQLRPQLRLSIDA
jgi:hypothetical protein